MVRNRVGFLLLTGLFFALGAIVACGGSAEPDAEFRGNSGVVTTPAAAVATKAPEVMEATAVPKAVEQMEGMAKPAGTLIQTITPAGGWSGGASFPFFKLNRRLACRSS